VEKLIPGSREELIKLKKIWNKCDLQKIGYEIHAGGKTQHAIKNSEFCIKVTSK